MTRTQRQIEEVRKGGACIEVRNAAGRRWMGVPVSVEQERHEFVFGCVAPDLSVYADADRERYQARLDEVFNVLVRAAPTEPGTLRVDVAELVPLGVLLRRLDALAEPDLQLQVHVWGEAVGMTADANERNVGKRIADLYTLCFSHPAVSGLFWNGVADGEAGVRGGGLLRRDLAPKYAHKVLQKLIGFVWHSRASGVTDAAGQFRFRGFFGDYRVVAGEAAALVDTFALHHDSAGAVHTINRESPR